MTGSTGSAYGLRLLEALRETGVESHFVACSCAYRRIEEETGEPLDALALADRVYGEHNQAARISSGSFLTEGMVISPCSARAAAAIAHGMASNLVHRAADVTLKEGRKLVLLLREAPLSLLHLESLRQGMRANLVVMPLVPAGPLPPDSAGDLVDQTVRHILDQFGLRQRTDTPPASQDFRETPLRPPRPLDVGYHDVKVSHRSATPEGREQP